MHITMTVVGSRGDVQPFVALGRGIQEEGNVVRIATHEIHASLVRTHGLEFAPIRGNPRELMEGIKGQAWQKSGRNLLTFWNRFRKLAGEAIEESFHDAEEACRGTDAILFTFFGASGYSVAEKMGVPCQMALLQPFSRTREFPCWSLPFFPPGGAFNWWSYLLTEQLSWMVGRRWVNRWRVRSLELDPLPLLRPFDCLYDQGVPFLYGFSRHVVPPPVDWPPNHEVTGYWFLDDGEAWSPPDQLVDFLASGPAPICLGFGSMAGDLARELTDTAVEALYRARKRAVLLGGWAAAMERDFPEYVFATDSAPHDWLFPRMEAVVHHGGAGTTAAGLRAGLPTVVVPFFADQPFWGNRIHTLRAGPRPLKWKDLSPETLADALRQATSVPSFRRRASELGERIRDEDGVGKGVERVLEHFAG
jgi:UDP:flavonoid glycosyltransferase YjiC (YdhE family)